MPAASRVHDRAVLDALEAIDPISFNADVWRITRKGREALRGSSAHGRWSAAGQYEVLYTSTAREGALAEVGHRLSIEPVWPSQLEHELHKIRVSANRILALVGIEDLAALGVDVARYATFDFAGTQAVAAAAHFLQFEGMLVPSARCQHPNLILFIDRLVRDGDIELLLSEDVNWDTWRNRSPD